MLAARCACAERGVVSHGLPAEDDSIRVRRHHVNIIARTTICSEVVPESGNHPVGVQPLKRANSIVSIAIFMSRRRRVEIESAARGDGDDARASLEEGYIGGREVGLELVIPDESERSASG